MPGSRRKIEIQVLGDARQLERTFKHVGRQAHGLNRDITRAFSGLAKGAAFGGVAAAVGGIAVVLHEGMKEYNAMAKVAAQTNAVIKSTGGVAAVSGKHVAKMATSLQNLSGVEDEVIQSGSNVLLSFTNIQNRVGKGNKIFDRATKAALDYSVRTGKSIPAAALVLGKALEDPAKKISGLARAGIIFSEKQKKVIARLAETGHILEAQKIILTEWTKRFGGAAAAAGKTFAGSLGILKANFRDLSAQVVGAFMPAIQRGVQALTGFVQKLSEAKGIKAKLSVVWSGLTGIANSIAGKIADAVSSIDWKAAPYKIRAWLSVVWQGAKDITKRAQAALKRAVAAIDWKDLGAKATGFGKGLEAAVAKTDFGGVGKKIGDKAKAAAAVAAEKARKMADQILAIARQIDWIALGRAMGPGLAAAIGSAFVALTNPGFWIHNWDVLLAVALVALGGPIGKLAAGIGMKFVALFARLAIRLFPVTTRLMTSLFYSMGGILPRLFKFLASAIDDGVSKIWKMLPKRLRFVLKWFTGVGALAQGLQVIKNAFVRFAIWLDKWMLRVALQAIRPFVWLDKKLGGHMGFEKLQRSWELALFNMEHRTEIAAARMRRKLGGVNRLAGGGPLAPLGTRGPTAGDPTAQGGRRTIPALLPLSGPHGVPVLPPTMLGPRDAPTMVRGVPGIARVNRSAAVGVAMLPPKLPPPGAGGGKANKAAFDKKLAGYDVDLSRAALSPSQGDDLAVLLKIKAATMGRLKLHKSDLTLQQKLIETQGQINALEKTGWERGIQKLTLALARAAATPQISDDLAVLKQTEAAVKRRLKLNKDDLDLQGQLVDVQGQINSLRQTQVDKAKGTFGGLGQGAYLASDMVARAKEFGYQPTASDYGKDLAGQTKAFISLNRDIGKVAARGGPSSLIAELKGMGEAAAPIAKALAEGSASAFRDFVASWQKAQAAIQKVAKVEMTAQSVVIKTTGGVHHGAGDRRNYVPPVQDKGGGGRHDVGRHRFASGGVVPGHGKGDTVAAMLSPGELVLNDRQIAVLGAKLGTSGAHGVMGAARFAGGGVIKALGKVGTELAGQLGVGSVRGAPGGEGLWKLLSKGQDPLAAIRYSAVDSPKMNRYLRAGARLPAGLAKRRAGMDKLIATRGLPEDVVLYRGVPAGYAAKNLKVGAVVRDKGFLNTSTSEALAVKRASGSPRNILRIEAPKGTGYVAGADYEKEIILRRNMPLKITGKDVGEDSRGRVLNTWRARSLGMGAFVPPTDDTQKIGGGFLGGMRRGAKASRRWADLGDKAVGLFLGTRPSTLLFGPTDALGLTDRLPQGEPDRPYGKLKSGKWGFQEGEKHFQGRWEKWYGNLSDDKRKRYWEVENIGLLVSTLGIGGPLAAAGTRGLAGLGLRQAYVKRFGELGAAKVTMKKGTTRAVPAATGAAADALRAAQARKQMRLGPTVIPSDVLERAVSAGENDFFFHGSTKRGAAKILHDHKIRATEPERSGAAAARATAWVTTNPSVAAFRGNSIVVIPRSAIEGQVEEVAGGIYSSPKDIVFAAEGPLGKAVRTQRQAALSPGTGQIATEFGPHAGVDPSMARNWTGLTTRKRMLAARATAAAADPFIRRAAKKLGVPISGRHTGVALWRGETNPGRGYHVDIPDGEMTPRLQKRLEALTAFIASVYRQGSVPYGHPAGVGVGGDDVFPSVLWKPGAGMTKEKLAAVQAGFDDVSKGNVGITHSPEGQHSFYITNYGVEDALFKRMLAERKIVGQHLEWQGGYVYDPQAYPAAENPFGTSTLSALKDYPGLQDLVGQARSSVDRALGEHGVAPQRMTTRATKATKAGAARIGEAVGSAKGRASAALLGLLTEQKALVRGGKLPVAPYGSLGAATDATRAMGGATLYADTLRAVASTDKDHFFAGLGAYSKMVPAAKFAEQGKRALASYRSSHSALLDAHKDFRLGTWIDKDGDLHLDIVKAFTKAQKAVAFAKRQGQIAAFDYSTLENLPTGLGKKEALAIQARLAKTAAKTKPSLAGQLLWDQRGGHALPKAAARAAKVTKGIWKDSAGVEHLPLGAEPGTVPIPPEYTRLYHYTGSIGDIVSIAKTGIRNDRAKGESYMEPSQIWASASKPNDHIKDFAEFAIRPDDPRLNIGRFDYPYTNPKTGKPHTAATWAEYMNAGGRDVTIPFGDIRPDEIINYSEPWMSHVRYLQDNYNLRTLEDFTDPALGPSGSKSWADDLKDMGPVYGTAGDWFGKHLPKKTKTAIIRDRKIAKWGEGAARQAEALGKDGAKINDALDALPKRAAVYELLTEQQKTFARQDWVARQVREELGKGIPSGRFDALADPGAAAGIAKLAGKAPKAVSDPAVQGSRAEIFAAQTRLGLTIPGAAEFYPIVGAEARMLSAKSGISHLQSAALMAATSLEATPPENAERLVKAIHQFKAWEKVGRPRGNPIRIYTGKVEQDVFKILKGHVDLDKLGKKRSSYGWAILEHTDPELFAKLYKGRPEPVVVDRHVSQALFGKTSPTELETKWAQGFIRGLGGRVSTPGSEVQATQWAVQKAMNLYASRRVRYGANAKSVVGKSWRDFIGDSLETYGDVFAKAKFAGGGIARGGHPGKDSIPALLAPGEVVLNASQIARLTGNLGIPNSGHALFKQATRMATGGVVPPRPYVTTMVGAGVGATAAGSGGGNIHIENMEITVPPAFSDTEWAIQEGLKKAKFRLMNGV